MVMKPPANAGDVRDMGSVPQSGRSPGEGNDNPLQYSCLENPVDRGFWSAAVHGVTKSQTRLSRHLGYLVSLNDIHNSCRFFFFNFFSLFSLL